MTAPFAARFDRVRQRMDDTGCDVLLLSVGADLPWLCGYEAMPLERLTMLVVPVDHPATLIVPGLEATRVTEHPELFSVRGWGESENPVELVAALVGRRSKVAIGDRTWARFLIELQHAARHVHWSRSNDVVGPLRAVKDGHEVATLHEAGAAVDRIAQRLQAGEIELIGRTEAELSAELSRQILAEGHHRVNFAIVAAGPNAASPHHEAGRHVIAPGEVVLCDFGGTMLDSFGVGYCSDITRCVWTGEIPTEAAEVYSVLERAHAAAVDRVAVGASCESVDAAARSVITDADYGEFFIHRTGHGIGVEEHEDPYIVVGNDDQLVVGHCFSIEPGIYLPGWFGFRLEDCFAATPTGPDPFTRVDHSLVAVES